jgi:hypothetical protein
MQRMPTVDNPTVGPSPQLLEFQQKLRNSVFNRLGEYGL